MKRGAIMRQIEFQINKMRSSVTENKFEISCTFECNSNDLSRDGPIHTKLHA